MLSSQTRRGALPRENGSPETFSDERPSEIKADVGYPRAGNLYSRAFLFLSCSAIELDTIIIQLFLFYLRVPSMI